MFVWSVDVRHTFVKLHIVCLTIRGHVSRSLAYLFAEVNAPPQEVARGPRSLDGFLADLQVITRNNKQRPLTTNDDANATLNRFPDKSKATSHTADCCWLQSCSVPHLVSTAAQKKTLPTTPAVVSKTNLVFVPLPPSQPDQHHHAWLRQESTGKPALRRSHLDLRQGSPGPGVCQNSQIEKLERFRELPFHHAQPQLLRKGHFAVLVLRVRGTTSLCGPRGPAFFISVAALLGDAGRELEPPREKPGEVRALLRRHLEKNNIRWETRGNVSCSSQSRVGELRSRWPSGFNVHGKTNLRIYF